jgi:hypothetical protein
VLRRRQPFYATVRSRAARVVLPHVESISMHAFLFSIDQSRRRDNSVNCCSVLSVPGSSLVIHSLPTRQGLVLINPRISPLSYWQWKCQSLIFYDFFFKILLSKVVHNFFFKILLSEQQGSCLSCPKETTSSPSLLLLLTTLPRRRTSPK